MSDLDPWSYLARLGVKFRGPSDPFFADGDAAANARNPVLLTQEDLEELLHPDLREFPCPAPGCPATFRQLLDFETHTATLHKHECAQCGKSLPTAHLLELHLSESHDSFFAVSSSRKASFQCFLQKCRDVFWNGEERRRHCVKVHHFEVDFDKICSVGGGDKGDKKEEEDMEVEDVQQQQPPETSQIPRPSLATRLSENCIAASPRTSSLSPKLKPGHLRRSSAAAASSSNSSRTRMARPQSLMILGSESNNSRTSKDIIPSKPKVNNPSPIKEMPTSRIPVRHTEKKEEEVVDKEVTPDRRRFSLAMITGSPSPPARVSPERQQSNNSPKNDRRKSEPLRTDQDDNPYSAERRRQSCDTRREEENEPHLRRAPLSLARMGERLSLSRSSVLDVHSNGSSNNSSSSPEASSNSSSSHSCNNNSTASFSPSKRSRIPIFKRSQSLKVPKQISFGSEVERAFMGVGGPHWHSRTDGGRGDSSEKGFEVVDMREALDHCRF